jgi:hypothetical protein
MALESPNGGINSAAEAGAHVITPAFANGVASQLTDTARDYMVYLTCDTGGTGFSLAIGPTNATANTIVNGLAVAAGDQYSIRLPAGWFLKWTATTATFADQLAVGC